MTSKTKALLASIVTGFFVMCAGIANMPMEISNQIPQPFPQAYRGYITVVFLVLGWIGRTYATHQASHSGPSSPPVNPPQ